MYINISIKELDQHKSVEYKLNYLNSILEHSWDDNTDELHVVITNVDVDSGVELTEKNNFGLKMSTKDDLHKLIAELKFLYGL